MIICLGFTRRNPIDDPIKLDAGRVDFGLKNRLAALDTRPANDTCPSSMGGLGYHMQFHFPLMGFVLF